MTFRLNGVEHDSWDDVPEDVRHLLAKALPDEDHNGVPDVFEGRAEPGHRRYTARLVATETTEVSRVRRAGTRPGFRFTMTTSDVHPVAPEPEDLAVEARAPVPTEADGPIVLNGVEVGPDGLPLRKKRWWRRV